MCRRVAPRRWNSSPVSRLAQQCSRRQAGPADAGRTGRRRPTTPQQQQHEKARAAAPLQPALTRRAVVEGAGRQGGGGPDQALAAELAARHRAAPLRHAGDRPGAGNAGAEVLAQPFKLRRVRCPGERRDPGPFRVALAQDRRGSTHCPEEAVQRRLVRRCSASRKGPSQHRRRLGKAEPRQHARHRQRRAQAARFQTRHEGPVGQHRVQSPGHELLV